MTTTVTPQGHLLLQGLSGDFNLPQTLDCGQAFRWRPLPDGSWQGVACGQLLRLAAQGPDIILYNTTPAQLDTVWRRYFDLERDYAAQKTAFAADPVLREAMGYAPGIRVLRQPAWETLVTFIISANNNIPRIKGIVERLCALLGDELAPGCYSFPTPARLACQTPESLAPLRCGYRADYLLDAAARVADGRLDLEAVAGLDTPAARQALQTVKGVGPKVADCVLLFGFGRVECFPLDTWMKKVTATLYPQGLPDWLLPQAGLAQQYLFHYARHHGQLLATGGK